MTEGAYQVVIRPEGGVEEEHAELLRKELIRDNWHDHVVHVEPVEESDE